MTKVGGIRKIMVLWQVVFLRRQISLDYYTIPPATQRRKFLRPNYHVKSVEKQTIKPEKHHCVLPHYLRTNKSLHHRPSHKELARTGLDYSLTKRKCAKMQTKILYSPGSTSRNMKHAKNRESVRQT